MHVLYFIIIFGDNSKVRIKKFIMKKKKNSALWSDMADRALL